MKREFSAGGIVLRLAQDGNVEVLITQHSKNKHWGFPKGHIETGQTAKEAAIREVREEGGVQAEIIEKVGDNKYFYTMDGEKRFKIVVIFLMKYLSGDPKDHDFEVSEAKWCTPEEALSTLSFPADKTLLKKAVALYGK